MILTQCFLQELTTTKSNGIEIQTTEINLHEEIMRFLDLTALLKQERFLVKDDLVITGPGDHMRILRGGV
jgi:hypothetical protein